MRGRNQLELCEAEMIRAMQYYVESMWKYMEAPTVVNVKTVGHINPKFVIELEGEGVGPPPGTGTVVKE